MRVFISHSSKNEAEAAEVCKKIEAAGFSCFFAPRDIRSGHEYAEEIVNGIDGSDVVLLMLSQAADSSPHVLREIERAVSRKKSIIVYKLEEVTLSKSMEYFLMTHQWLSRNGDSGFDKVIQRLNEFAANDGESPQPQQSGAPAIPAGDNPEVRTRRKVILIAFIAAVILAAAGVVTGSCLANRAPANPAPPASEQHSPAPEVGAPQPNSAPEQPSQQEAPSSQPEPVPVDKPLQQDEHSTNSQPQDEPAPAPQGTENQPGTHSEPTAVNPVTTEAAAPQTTATGELPPESQPIPTQPESPQPTEPEVTAAAVELGDSLMFGSYNGEPIEWRVIRISEDGTQAVVISDDILTMKAYDAAEGGKYNKYDGGDYWTTKLSEMTPEIQRLVRGDNRWEFSNIRTWLNSDRENVVYTGQAPTSQAMSELRNGYHTEAGFLNGFTKAERSALLESPISTNGGTTLDKVFLLSSQELDWLYDADVSVFAEPTPAAVEQDDSYWYKVDCEAYGVDDHFWWLRDANPDNSCECYYINISYSDQRTASGSVGLEGYGIRPAMTLDLTSGAVKQALENEYEAD
ncbi:MAG: TIR domain-containing protein [Oscillospiraceae bacterium]